MVLDWYRIANESGVESPAVLLFPERIEENIRRMIALSGDVERLRPHVKTHKLPQVIRMQLEAGITRFKCATLSEAAMSAEAGASDMLLAYPLYGPAVVKLLQLKMRYPGVRFATLIDNQPQATALERQAEAASTSLDVYLDIDVGMGRTGIEPGPEALELYRYAAGSRWLNLCGLHLYDGHLHQPELEQREAGCAAYFIKIQAFILELHAAGFQTPELICGGTPTFPIHARYPDRTLSPGTTLLWDWGYATKFKDLPFLNATVLLTRVVSKPGRDKLCLDLGHKALASEMPPPRIWFFDLPDWEPVGHSEEHLVISTPDAGRFAEGDCLYGIPIHICPTMALHDTVWAVTNRHAEEKWRVAARTRELSV